MDNIRESIAERKRNEKRLRADLPDTTTSREYENVLNTLRNELREWEERRAIAPAGSPLSPHRKKGGHDEEVE